MIDFINKSVWVVLNPMTVGLMLILLGIVLRRFRRISLGCAVCAAIWFYLLSTRLGLSLVGAPLEREFLANGRMADAESYPTADVILDFGGGVGANANVSKYAELYQSADRAYFAATLWKAGKAPIIIPSSGNAINCDAKFLKDLGVPESAIVVENEAKNTEENAKLVRKMVEKWRGGEVKGWSGGEVEKRPKVLLVTSAWHMKRSLLMMKKYASELEVAPAPCDFEATQMTLGGFEWAWLKPDPSVFFFNSVCLHEWLGYWGYKLLR